MGVLAGLAAAALAGAAAWYWGGTVYPLLRIKLTGVAVMVAFVAVRWLAVAWLGLAARCKVCGAVYCVSRVGREETFLSAIPRRRESVVGRSISGPNEGKTLVRKESWTEERYQVVETHACSVCGDQRRTQSVRTVTANKVSDDIYRR